MHKVIKTLVTLGCVFAVTGPVVVSAQSIDQDVKGTNSIGYASADVPQIKRSLRHQAPLKSDVIVATASKDAGINVISPELSVTKPDARASSSNGEKQAVGPVTGATRLGISAASRAETPVSLAAFSPRAGQSVALMLVGGGALIAGLIIGDDVGTLISVSGVVVGLYGLYNYVK